MKIWAHRGCSQLYPENTITAFEHAMEIPGLTGIELDIQLSKDGELVVIHDERVDRTTDGIGYVRDFTLKELKGLNINTGNEVAEHIPTMREVFELLIPSLKSDHGILLNIELKNSIFPYRGMEEKIVDMVHELGVQDRIVYSSFYADSLVKLYEFDEDISIGVLDGKLSDCMYKAMGIESLLGSRIRNPISLHPAGYSIDISADRVKGRNIRAYFSGHLYPEKPSDKCMDIGKFGAMGVTDLFLNEPDKYMLE